MGNHLPNLHFWFQHVKVNFLGGGFLWISPTKPTGVFLDRLLGGNFKFGREESLAERFSGVQGSKSSESFAYTWVDGPMEVIVTHDR